MCKLECLHPCVLVLALALALLLCIKFLGAWQQCVHYNKNNNAYNADTTSDAIQASTWWACRVSVAPELQHCKKLAAESFQMSLNRGGPLLCLNKLNKSTSTLRTQQTTTPILDNVMCRNLMHIRLQLEHERSALIKLPLQLFHLGFQLKVFLLELCLCAFLPASCTSSMMSIDFFEKKIWHFHIQGFCKSGVLAGISAMDSTRFFWRWGACLFNFFHHPVCFLIAIHSCTADLQMTLSLAMVQAQHYWSYIHNQQHTHIYTCK